MLGETTRVENLYWLIHPFYWKGFYEGRDELAGRVKEGIALGDQGSLLAFMPGVEENVIEWRYELRELRLKKSMHSRRTQWPSLYHYFRSKYPGKTVLVPDVVFKRDDAGPMIDSLSRYGYEIGRYTKVIVGGELLDQCVRDGVLKLLKSGRVGRVLIDINMVRPSTHIDMDGAVEFVARTCAMEGYEVAVDGGKKIDIHVI